MTVNIAMQFDPITGEWAHAQDSTGSTGGGATYDPTYDPAFVNFMASGPSITDLMAGNQLPSVPGSIAGPGIGGIVNNWADKLGIPAWLLIALGAATSIYVLHEVGV